MSDNDVVENRVGVNMKASGIPEAFCIFVKYNYTLLNNTLQKILAISKRLNICYS